VGAADPTGTYCRHTNAAIRSYAGLVSQNVELPDSLVPHSAYHRRRGEPQGAETQFTHAYRRWPTHLFHIDYYFYSADSFRLSAVNVPPVAEWADSGCTPPRHPNPPGGRHGCRTPYQAGGVGPFVTPARAAPALRGCETTMGRAG
jgi:hypothetical protein